MFKFGRPLTPAWCSGVFLALILAANLHGDILKWNTTFLQSVRQDSTAPAQVSRRLAILYLAAHDASELGEDSFFKSSPKPPSQNLHPEASALGALASGALIFYPSHRAAYLTLLKDYQKSQSEAGVDSKVLRESLAYGKAFVHAYLKAREDDGASSQRTFFPSNKPGQWRRTPPHFRPPELSHWGKVRPFLLTKPEQFRAPPPPALDSKEYLEALEIVRKKGGKNSSKKSRDLAEFWSCFSYTSTPSGHWNTILADLLEKKKITDPSAILDAFTILNVTLADTAIACWDTKFHYRLWRPEDAIRASLNPDWEPSLQSPPHPEYVSGHSSFAGAGARILELIFKGDAYKFSASSDSLPGILRKYESFSTCAREMGHSRILGGIHFPFSDEEGQKLGRKVADHCWKKFTGSKR